MFEIGSLHVIGTANHIRFFLTGFHVKRIEKSSSNKCDFSVLTAVFVFPSTRNRFVLFVLHSHRMMYISRPVRIPWVQNLWGLLSSKIIHKMKICRALRALENLKTLETEGAIVSTPALQGLLEILKFQQCWILRNATIPRAL